MLCLFLTAAGVRRWNAPVAGDPVCRLQPATATAVDWIALEPERAPASPQPGLRPGLVAAPPARGPKTDLFAARLFTAPRLARPALWGRVPLLVGVVELRL